MGITHRGRIEHTAIPLQLILCTGERDCVTPTPYWIKELLLTDEERRIIASGEVLTDLHINAVQKLLSNQFPDISGLQSSCFSQGNRFKRITSPGIQVHHTGCFHWVTTTSIASSHSCRARLFDSAAGSIPTRLKTQIAQLYGASASKVCLEISPAQQVGGADCGVFALAFATDLSFGNDPAKISYAQREMRDHLLLCLEQQQMEPFPRARRPANICVRTIESFSVFCLCQLPETEDMVCCDKCNSWYHYHCVGIREESDLPNCWYCKSCKPQNKRKRL